MKMWSFVPSRPTRYFKIDNNIKKSVCGGMSSGARGGISCFWDDGKTCAAESLIEFDLLLPFNKVFYLKLRSKTEWR